MSRTFAYCRVSTAEQTTANQLQEIRAAGFDISEKPKRYVEETISGTVPAMERPGFASLFEKLEPGDVLVVTKLDRLGRDAIDISKTVTMLTSHGVEVHCLALGKVELGTAIGTMMMNMLSAFSQFERDLIAERTRAGVRRARAQGKTLGRPKALTDAEKDQVREAVKGGASFRSVAKTMKVSHATVMRACGAI